AYLYNALNEMTRVTQSGNGVHAKRVDIAYNEVGQFASINRFADLAGTQLVAGTAFGYDNLDRLTSLTHHNAAGSTLDFENLTYDAVSRITQIAFADGTTNYSYDNVDELIAANHGDPTNPNESYAYDANGNRVSSSHSSSYTTGPNNQLLSDGTFNYAYDKEGNLISRTEIATGKVRLFRWDFRDRLSSVVDKDAAGNAIQEVDFTYDAFDRRISKTVTAGGNSVTTDFVYDGDNVLLDFKATGMNPPTLKMRYLNGPAVDQVFAQE